MAHPLRYDDICSSNAVKLLPKIDIYNGYIKLYTELDSHFEEGDKVYITYSGDTTNFNSFTLDNIILSSRGDNYGYDNYAQGYNILVVDKNTNSFVIDKLISDIDPSETLDGHFASKIVANNIIFKKGQLDSALFKNCTINVSGGSFSDVNFIQAILLNGDIYNTEIQSKFEVNYLTLKMLYTDKLIKSLSYNNSFFGYSYFYNLNNSIVDCQLYSGNYYNCSIKAQSYSYTQNPDNYLRISAGYYENCECSAIIVQGGSFSNTKLLNHSEWLNGVWLAGNFNLQNWYNGTFNGGTFGDSEDTHVWYNGTFNSGIFNGSKWSNGTFNNGVYDGYSINSANYCKSVWENGIFNGGVMKYTNWSNGTFNLGTFENNRWNNGTFNNGTFTDSIWFGGNFNDGTLINSSWFYGNFNNGIITNVNWNNGELYNTNATNLNCYGGAIYNGNILNSNIHSADISNGSFKNTVLKSDNVDIYYVQTKQYSGYVSLILAFATDDIILTGSCTLTSFIVSGLNMATTITSTGSSKLYTNMVWDASFENKTGFVIANKLSGDTINIYDGLFKNCSIYDSEIYNGDFNYSNIVDNVNFYNGIFKDGDFISTTKSEESNWFNGNFYNSIFGKSNTATTTVEYISPGYTITPYFIKEYTYTISDDTTSNVSRLYGLYFVPYAIRYIIAFSDISEYLNNKTYFITNNLLRLNSSDSRITNIDYSDLNMKIIVDVEFEKIQNYYNNNSISTYKENPINLWYNYNLYVGDETIILRNSSTRTNSFSNMPIPAYSTTNQIKTLKYNISVDTRSNVVYSCNFTKYTMDDKLKCYVYLKFIENDETPEFFYIKEISNITSMNVNLSEPSIHFNLDSNYSVTVGCFYTTSVITIPSMTGIYDTLSNITSLGTRGLSETLQKSQITVNPLARTINYVKTQPFKINGISNDYNTIYELDSTLYDAVLYKDMKFTLSYIDKGDETDFINNWYDGNFSSKSFKGIWRGGLLKNKIEFKGLNMLKPYYAQIINSSEYLQTTLQYPYKQNIFGTTHNDANSVFLINTIADISMITVKNLKNSEYLCISAVDPSNIAMNYKQVLDESCVFTYNSSEGTIISNYALKIKPTEIYYLSKRVIPYHTSELKISTTIDTNWNIDILDYSSMYESPDINQSKPTVKPIEFSTTPPWKKDVLSDDLIVKNKLNKSDMYNNF